YRRQRDGEPKIIPLIVGEVPKASLPGPIRQDPDLRKFNVPAGRLSSSDDLKLQEAVRATLDLPIPVVVPGAFIAMTKSQAKELHGEGTGEDNDALSALCSTVGMEPFPKLKESLLQRYGDEAEDFSPFPEKTLKEIVSETIGDMNQVRLSGKEQTPLWIWWCTEELFDPQHRDRKLASQLWEQGPSIAVVDSISVFHDAIYNQFTNLPDPQQPALSALLWVPPYTLHTAKLEKVTEGSVGKLLKLLRKFEKWGSESGGYLAFDIGTRPTLRRWIYQAFINVTSRPIALTSNVDVMEKAHKQNQFKPTGFFTSKS